MLSRAASLTHRASVVRAATNEVRCAAPIAVASSSPINAMRATRSASSSRTYSSLTSSSASRRTPIVSSRLINASSLITSYRRGFASLPDHIVLTMPALSPTMEKGNLATWKVKVGDKVKPGDVMAEVETDKATVAFESVEEGYIAKILIADGTQDIVVGTPVAVLTENKDDVNAFTKFDGKADAAPKKAATPAAAAAAPEATTASSPAASSSSSAASSSGGRVIASPAARRVANEKGVSLDGIQGTGPNDRIVQADVLEQGGKAAAVSAPKAQQASSTVAASPKPIAPMSEGSYVDIPNSNVRKVIAQRLSQSKQTIPHYYLSSDVTMDAVLKLRSELNATLEKQSKDKSDLVKLSVNDFIIKAAALACKAVPQANSSWTDSYIRHFNYVDVSVAVSTDAGLVTPIVKDADVKGLATISTDVKLLASKARANKLQPAEYQGGTFTISNLGMFGVKSFSAIINPPQACILAVGATEPRLVPSKDGSTAVAQVMSVTLSCDHRVVDGAVGAQWLQAFKSYIEKPSTMLL